LCGRKPVDRRSHFFRALLSNQNASRERRQGAGAPGWDWLPATAIAAGNLAICD